MEGFKKSEKMQCFREGGSVKYKSRHSEKSEMSKDVAQDKKIVKKAFSMHDKQKHEGKTNLTKLNSGGRAKKECGTVKKYQAGGKIKKYADGQAVTAEDPNDIGGSILRKIGKVPMVGGALQSGATKLRDNVMGTPEQNRIARARMQEMARKKAMAAAAAQGQSAPGIADAAAGAALGGAAAPAAGAAGAAPLPVTAAPMKNGRKVKKMNMGGSSGVVSPVAQEIIEGKRPAQSTPGKMTPEERRASVAKAFGAGAKKMNTGGTCS
jgi:hypothetical protein